MMKKKIIIIGVIVLLLGAGAIYYYNFSIKADEENTADTLTRTVFVKEGDISETFFADGQVQSQLKVDVTAEISSRIDEVLIEPGDKVTSGDTLFILDNEDLEINENKMKNELERIKIKLEEQKANLAAQKDEVAKTEKLYKKEAATEKELSDARLKLETLKREVALMQREVENAEFGLESARLNYEKSFITSFISGVVTSVNVNSENLVNSNTVLARVIDMNPLDVKVYVDEIDYNKLKSDQQATIRVDTYEDKEFTGKVYYISEEGLNEQGVITFPTYIEVDNQELSLKPGMTAEAELVVIEKNNVLLIPTEAIKRENNRKYVEIKIDDEIEKRTIETGISSGGYTEIKEGLQKMDRVVVTMKSQVNPYTDNSSDQSSSKGLGSFMPSIFGGQ